MDMGIDVDMLIVLVEARPVLWDKTLEDYKNRDFTRKAWAEVCVALNNEFENMDDKLKDSFCKEVIKRWANLRDAYARAQKRMKTEKTSGSGAKKGKQYLYQEEMRFLNKLHEQRGTVDSLTEEGEALSEDMDDSTQLLDDSQLTVETGPGTSTAKTSTFKQPLSKKHKKMDEVELKILEALKPKEQEKPDPNMNFFMSLIPHIKSYSGDEILQFQMGVLQVISDISNRKKSYPHSQSYHPQSSTDFPDFHYNQSYPRAPQPQLMPYSIQSPSTSVRATPTPPPYPSTQIPPQHFQGSSLFPDHQTNQRAPQQLLSIVSPGSSTSTTPTPTPPLSID